MRDSVGQLTEVIEKIPNIEPKGASKNLLGLTQALRFLNDPKNDDTVAKIHRDAFEQKKLISQKQFIKKYDLKRISHYIPILYMPYTPGSSKLLIYFHANAEDIVLSHDMLDYMRVLLRVNVVAVEYPGYGLYT